MRDEKKQFNFLFLFALIAALFGPAAALHAEDEKPPEPNAITLQGLNKVTGKTLKFDGLLGTVLRFGNLEIVPRRCWKSPPEERPENAALLEISELKQGEAPAQVFLGWMFSSSPSLSGLEHPVYDIAVISCDIKAKAEKEETDAADDKKSETAKPKK